MPSQLARLQPELELTQLEVVECEPAIVIDFPLASDATKTTLSNCNQGIVEFSSRGFPDTRLMSSFHLDEAELEERRNHIIGVLAPNLNMEAAVNAAILGGIMAVKKLGDAPPRLSKLEKTILKATAKGSTETEIGEKYQQGSDVVEQITKGLLRKMGTLEEGACNNKTHLVRRGHEFGLLSPV